MSKKTIKLLFILLVTLNAGPRNHAYPEDMTLYRMADSKLIVKITPNSYVTVFDSIPNAHLIYSILIYSDEQFIKSNECLFSKDSSEIQCPINEYNLNRPAFIIQTILSRPILITGQEKRDVIDQSPLIDMQSIDN